MNNNAKLVKVFEDLALYQNKEHENKPVLQKIFLNAANLISISNKIVTPKTKIYDPLMTKGIYDIIKEFLETGKSNQLIKLQKKYNPKLVNESGLNELTHSTNLIIDIDEIIVTPKNLTIQEKIDLLNHEDRKVVDLFLSFYGIGPVKAFDLFELGYTTLEQLWDNKDKVLTNSQQLGIIWRNHIPIRIPREEMWLIFDQIYSILYPLDIRFEIVGSFRRQELSSGDIDILIEKTEEVDMEKILDLLHDYLPAIFSKGEKKSSGMFRLNEDYYGHRIDILLIEEKSWPLALLYFTGSAAFNPLIRLHAIKLGYKLNEYRLVKGTDEEIDIKNEKDVFDELNLKYLLPEERTNDLKRLLSKNEEIKKIISTPELPIENKNLVPLPMEKRKLIPNRIEKKNLIPVFPRSSVKK